MKPQYIDKATVVAEIEKYITNYKRMSVGIERKGADWVDSVSMLDAKIDTLHSVLSFLNRLEVKEVDLKKAIDGLTAGWIEGEEYGELQNINTCRCVTLGEVKEAMRCMFELGLNAKVVWSEDI